MEKEPVVCCTFVFSAGPHASHLPCTPVSLFQLVANTAPCSGTWACCSAAPYCSNAATGQYLQGWNFLGGARSWRAAMRTWTDYLVRRVNAIRWPGGASCCVIRHTCVLPVAASPLLSWSDGRVGLSGGRICLA
jgi:hypothetical protein